MSIPTTRAEQRATQVEYPWKAAIRTAVQVGIPAFLTIRHMLWLYCRELIDWIYRGKQPPPPAPPAGLFE